MRYLVITGLLFRHGHDLSSRGTFSLCIGSPRTSFPACHTSLAMIDITNYTPCCLASCKQQSIGHLINCQKIEIHYNHIFIGEQPYYNRKSLFVYSVWSIRLTSKILPQKEMFFGGALYPFPGIYVPQVLCSQLCAVTREQRTPFLEGVPITPIFQSHNKAGKIKPEDYRKDPILFTL